MIPPATSLCLTCGPGIHACHKSSKCHVPYVVYKDHRSYEEAKKRFEKNGYICPVHNACALKKKKCGKKKTSWPVVNKWLID